MTINMNVVFPQEKFVGNAGLKSLRQESVIVSREHDVYRDACDQTENRMKDIIEKRKKLKENEMKRIGNKPACEVTFVEKEWYQSMEREGSMSTRMY
jgi:hypothetical protein